jgi:hypothetical protein
MSTATDATHTRPRLISVSRAELVDGAFILVLGVLALIGFRTTYGGYEYLIVGSIGLVLGLVIAYLANTLRQPVITVAAMTVVVFFLLGGALSLRHAAAGGALPDGKVLRALAHVSISGWKDLLTTVPPVGTNDGLLAIPYILGLIAGAMGLTLAQRLRMPVAPALVSLAMLAAVILLGTEQPAAKLVQGVVFACVVLCWLSVRGYRRRRVQGPAGGGSRFYVAAGMIVVAAVGSTVIGAHLPGAKSNPRVVLRSYVEPPFNINDYPSPLVGFHRYKDAAQLRNQPLFTVSGIPAGEASDLPVRIATLDSYDGMVWGATSGAFRTTAGQLPDVYERVGSHIVSDGSGPTTALTFKIDPAYANAPDADVWVPDVGSPENVAFSGPDANGHAASFRFNPATDTAVVPDRLSAGDQYVLTTQLASPQLGSNPQPYGAPTISANAASLVAPQANKWASGHTGVWDRVLAVAQHLKSSGAYSDGGIGDARSPYLPGHSIGRLTQFLDVPSLALVGNDEQYAATFALMANELGMPARVVLGAIPGAGGVVTGNDIHAWVEVRVAGGGWAIVPQTLFMPPASQKPHTQPPPSGHAAHAAVVPPPVAASLPSQLFDADNARSTSQHVHPKHHTLLRFFHVPGYLIVLGKWLGIPILVVLALMGCVVAGKARRRHLRRSRGPAHGRFAKGWREVCDRARDIGTAVPSTGTRREQASWLEHLGVAQLAAEADAGVFGPGLPSEKAAAEYWKSVDLACRAMRKSLSRMGRIRAAVSLRSFLQPRVRPVAMGGTDK